MCVCENILIPHYVFLYISFQVSLHWYLGRALCDMWVSMDVLCCTASILHLVAIAFDRFWAVSNIDYVRRRCARQILFMIALVWLVSVAISIPPLFGWRHESDNPEHDGECTISQDRGYTIFSTVGAFYCPMILMLVLNFKIYRAARYRIRRKRFAGGGSGGGGGRSRRGMIPVPVVQVEETTARAGVTHNSSGSDVSQDGYSMYNVSCMNHEISRADTGIDSGQLSFNHLYASCVRDTSTDGSGSNPNESNSPVNNQDMPCMADNGRAKTNPTNCDNFQLCSNHVPSCGNGRLTADSVPVISNLILTDLRVTGLESRLMTEGDLPPDRNDVKHSTGEECVTVDPVTGVDRQLRCVSFGNGCGSNSLKCADQGLRSDCNQTNQLTLSCEVKVDSNVNELIPERTYLEDTLCRSVSNHIINGGSGAGGGGSGNQLTVPLGPAGLSGKDTKTRGNNNTKRAYNREKERQRREKLEMRRERKAARVLGIITGAFVLCWLPFFILALLLPFCGSSCPVPKEMTSLFLWLGYFNSLLNPIIYTIFNPSFRCAFRKIFFKRRRSVTR